MAKPRLLLVLLATALLATSFSRGVLVVEGRKVQVMRAVRHYARRRSPLHGANLQQQQQQAAPAGMVSTLTDYSEPKPNTNPHSGVMPPPDPTTPPAH